MLVLHKFDRHGLGDAVQFTAVLAHLKHYRPDERHVPVVRAGQASIFPEAFTAGPEVPYVNTAYWHDWHEPEQTYDGLPATKAVRCLVEKLKLQPRWELLRYQVQIPRWAYDVANDFIYQLKSRFVGIHYQGSTSRERKDLSHEHALTLCRRVKAKGFVPVVFDWHKTFALEGEAVRAAIPREAAVIAAVLEQAACNVCVDSGVQKLACAVKVPCLAVWTGNHPLHYCDNCPTAHHFIPLGHTELIKGDTSRVAFFFENYSYTVYTDLQTKLLAALDRYV